MCLRFQIKYANTYNTYLPGFQIWQIEKCITSAFFHVNCMKFQKSKLGIVKTDKTVLISHFVRLT